MAQIKEKALLVSSKYRSVVSTAKTEPPRNQSKGVLRFQEGLLELSALGIWSIYWQSVKESMIPYSIKRSAPYLVSAILSSSVILALNS